ncbi:hypothetical protein [Halopseudomonas aestusnigri]|uniref:Uncharacterized protein n=1 Tax=Halopseudomonas aestusnigri TaxID=857252 RepID=A0AAQ1G5I0_9GAMM|nr:hypothetical protein [Halopseudomonas aestusnigri]OWL90143.1 hypothetical protein B7O88_04390 [Halopseudomonas aestusnigri]SEF83836.1 hypothetical protein SAMN05216586_10271 [Halopseudomonas aestusnigri]
MITIQHAVREHGAEAVYKAACAALEGDYSKLAEMDIEASTLAEAWAAQTAAYKSMTAAERAREQMTVNKELMKIAKRKPGPVPTVNGKRRNVFIDDESVEYAQQLGDGNLSAGIRRAIEIARAQAEGEQ